MRAVTVLLHVSFRAAPARPHTSPPRAIIPKSQSRRKRARCAPLNSSRTLHRPIWLALTSPQAGSLTRFLSLSPKWLEVLTRTMCSLAKIAARLALTSEKHQQSSASSPPSSTVVHSSRVFFSCSVFLLRPSLRIPLDLNCIVSLAYGSHDLSS